MIPWTRIVLVLDINGTGSEVITFSQPFDNAPPAASFALVAPLASNGTISVGTITVNGCTLTMTTCTAISGSPGVAGRNCEIAFTVHEPL